MLLCYKVEGRRSVGRLWKLWYRPSDLCRTTVLLVTNKSTETSSLQKSSDLLVNTHLQPYTRSSAHIHKLTPRRTYLGHAHTYKPHSVTTHSCMYSVLVTKWHRVTYKCACVCVFKVCMSLHTNGKIRFYFRNYQLVNRICLILG